MTLIDTRRPAAEVTGRGVSVELTGITVRRRDALILDAVDLDLRPGVVTALVGSNGAGKSTIMNVLAGELRPESGSVRYDGVDVDRIRDLSGIVGIASESAGLDREASGRRNLKNLARALGAPARRVEELLDSLGARSFAHRPVKRLSTGQRRKIELAAALLTDPPVLVLDEPLNGLDLTAVEWFRDLLTALREQGRSVLISSHLLTELDRTADRVLVLHENRLHEIDDLDGHLGGVEQAFRKVLN